MSDAHRAGANRLQNQISAATVKVPQVALVKQLVDNVTESFTFSLFAQNGEASSARSRESPDAFCSSVAVGSCHTGGPCLLLTSTAGEGLGGTTKGARSPSSVAV